MDCRIEFKKSHLKNFLYLLRVLNHPRYSIMEKTRTFFGARFSDFTITPQDLKLLNKWFKLSDQKILDEISNHQHLKGIYEGNYSIFEEFANKQDIDSYVKFLKEYWQSFDKNLFRTVTRFFKFDADKTFEINVLVGNMDKIGRGKLCGNRALIFARDSLNSKYAQQEFRVLIHEIVHSFADHLDLKREEEERIVDCFAPNGILFPGQEVKDQVKLDLIAKIKKLMNARKTVDELSL